MKEIQGKIKFLVVEYQNQNKTTKDGFDIDALNKKLMELKYEDGSCFWLSKITEEQAAEFVGDVVNCGDGDIFTLRMYYNSKQKLRFILRENGFNTRCDGDFLLIKLT